MISLHDYAAHDGLGLAELVARKEVSPEELLNTVYAAVEKVNPQLNAVLQTLTEQATPKPVGACPKGRLLVCRS
jgi:amidase